MSLHLVGGWVLFFSFSFSVEGSVQVVGGVLSLLLHNVRCLPLAPSLHRALLLELVLESVGRRGRLRHRERVSSVPHRHRVGAVVTADRLLKTLLLRSVANEIGSLASEAASLVLVLLHRLVVNNWVVTSFRDTILLALPLQIEVRHAVLEVLQLLPFLLSLVREHDSPTTLLRLGGGRQTVKKAIRVADNSRIETTVSPWLLRFLPVLLEVPMLRVGGGKHGQHPESVWRVLADLGGRGLELLFHCRVTTTMVPHDSHQLHGNLFFARWIGTVQQTDVLGEGKPEALIADETFHPGHSADRVFQPRHKDLVSHEAVVQVRSIGHFRLSVGATHLHQL